MRTAAGQCCFFALPDRDASGRSEHARVRTMESLCAGWLVLHKVRCVYGIGLAMLTGHTRSSLHQVALQPAQLAHSPAVRHVASAAYIDGK